MKGPAGKVGFAQNILHRFSFLQSYDNFFQFSFLVCRYFINFAADYVGQSHSVLHIKHGADDSLCFASIIKWGEGLPKLLIRFHLDIACCDLI